MSLKEIEEGLKLIEGKKGCYFKGPIDSALISKAESFLELTFPISFKYFLEKKGAGSVKSKEFYGITSDDFNNGSVPNGIWLTADERITSKLDTSLIIIGQGYDTYLALDTSRMKNGECPVIEVVPNVKPSDCEIIYDDFGFYILEEIKQLIS